MWSWLNQIDPNIVLPIFATGLGWIWNKIRGEKKQDTRSIIDSVIGNFVHEMLDRYSLDSGDVSAYLKRARKFVDDRIWDVLKKRGVPKNKLTIQFVNAALERGTAELGKEVAKIRREAGRNPAG